MSKGYRGSCWTLVNQKNLWIGRCADIGIAQVIYTNFEDIKHDEPQIDLEELKKTVFDEEPKLYSGYYWRFIRLISKDRTKSKCGSSKYQQSQAELVSPSLVEQRGSCYWLKEDK